MITYLLQTNELYKIGKSTNLKKRLAAYATHNPNFKLLWKVELDIEKYLHYTFKDVRVTGEWFKLTQEQVDIILEIDDNFICPKLITVTKEANKLLDYFKRNDWMLELVDKPQMIFKYVNLQYNLKVNRKVLYHKNSDKYMRSLFMYIQHNIPVNAGCIRLDRHVVIEATVMSRLNYRKAINYLIDNQIIKRCKGRPPVYCVNPKYIFRGDLKEFLIDYFN